MHSKAVSILGAVLAANMLCQSSQAQESWESNLRQGGYVIYFRHAQASNEARPDAQLPAQIKDCKGARHVAVTRQCL